MRTFVGINLGRKPVPDRPTVCRFRRLLETHRFGATRFEPVRRHLAARGGRLATGPIVDVTMIGAVLDEEGGAGAGCRDGSNG